jgi:hypothetical protein
MAGDVEAQRNRRAFYALPFEARCTFRRAVAGARWGRPEPLAAFAAVGIHDVVVHTLDLLELAAEGIAMLHWQDRAAAEIALFKQALPTGLAPLIGKVRDHGRADGLDDRQLAGAVAVVLESHGLLAREAA